MFYIIICCRHYLDNLCIDVSLKLKAKGRNNCKVDNDNTTRDNDEESVFMRCMMHEV